MHLLVFKFGLIKVDEHTPRETTLLFSVLNEAEREKMKERESEVCGVLCGGGE